MRRIRLFGHPLHPPLTHLPLGLLVGAFVWDAVGLWRGGDPWWTLSFWTLALGLASAVPAALTGLLDLASLPEDHPGGARALQHLSAAVGAVGLFGASLLLRGGPGLPDPDLHPWLVLLSGAGVLLLGLAGWLGADLVIRFGVGVDSPETGEGT